MTRGSKRRAAALAITSAFFGCLCVNAFADQSAFNDFGAGFSYDPSTSWIVSTSSSYIGEDLRPASAFVSSATGTLTSIDIGLTHLDGDSSMTINLYADNGTGTGLGTLLESYSTFGGSVQHLVSAGGVSIVSGHQYWVQGVAHNDGWNGLGFNTQGSITEFLDLPYYDGTGTSITAAFDVNVTPEPSSLVAAGIGIALLGLRRRR